MAGGVFITQNKIRPGSYYKFTARERERNLFGVQGVAALPLELDWGETKKIIRIEADADTEEFLIKLGRPKKDLLLIRECLKRARTLLLYRVNSDGDKSKLDMTPQPVIATAKHSGIRGDDIAVQIVEDIDNAGEYIVTTYVNSIEQFNQKGIANAEDIKNNDWVDFSGNGAITAAAGGQLAGGTNGTAVVNDYNAFLELLELEEFNAFGLPQDDKPLKEMFEAATHRFNEELGMLVQCVLPEYPEGRYEAIISLKNGVVLEDGTVIDKTKAVAWFVGASSISYPQALTYTAYDGAMGVDEVLRDSDIKRAIQDGEVVFVNSRDEFSNDVALVELDINTFNRFTAEKPKEWRKNRVVRTLYHFVRSVTRTFNLYYLGKEHNNEQGRLNLKADICLIAGKMQEQSAIRDFDALEDLKVYQGDEIDAVVVEGAIQPVDAMEKLYFIVELQ